MAGWKKVGTFRILKGLLPRNNLTPGDAKEGGNVAAYFCTPDLRVVNAVLGNVGAETFLEEARRAVEMLDLVRGACPGESERLLGRAHGDVPRRVSWSPDPTYAVHQTLASEPLPALDAVYRKFFEDVPGETVSDREVKVVEAGALFRLNGRSRRSRRN